MKKTWIFLIICTLSLFLFISGCSKEEEESSSSDVTSSAETSEPSNDKPSSSEPIPPSSSSVPTVGSGEMAALDGKKVLYGPGLNADKNGRPIAAVNAQKTYGGYGGMFIMENTRNIYLTFDEGYENGHTGAILDILRDKNCKAVFFVTYGYAKSNPALVKRMIDEGHVVGNHTMNHPSMPEISTEKATDEIMGLHEYIEKNFGYRMTLFRPPQGDFSVRTLALAQSLGYKTVHWSFGYSDWDPGKQPDEQTAYDTIISRSHPGEICLLHAVSSTNTAILGRVIDRWRDMGYVVGPIG